MPYWPLSPKHDDAADLNRHFVGMFDFSYPLWAKLGNLAVGKARAGGVDYRFNIAAQRLVTTNGKVSGAIAQDAEGNYVKFQTKEGVILCTAESAPISRSSRNTCPKNCWSAKNSTSNRNSESRSKWGNPATPETGT